ncbi:hypothetical protein MLD52_16580 [Puniceicoccaceae bacterium K14]|nr:hypothetical protein [Puniceicoccaceae bacterium K14]
MNVLLKLGIAVCMLGALSGSPIIDEKLVGKWKTVSDLSENGFLDSVGWEIEFRSDGSLERLSDRGMAIQNLSEGTFMVLGNEFSLELSDFNSPLVFGYELSGDSLSLKSELFDFEFVRSEEPHVELRRLPKMPRSLDEAVDLLISEMSEENKNYTETRQKDDLIQFHLGWGMGIRNGFGLWSGNKELLSSCGNRWMHPDTASGVIIEAVWARLRSGLDPDFLAGLDSVHASSKTITFSGKAISDKTFSELISLFELAVREMYPDKNDDDYFELVVEVEEERDHWTARLEMGDDEICALPDVLRWMSFRWRIDVEYEPRRLAIVDDTM